ncbi:hypothetical protein CRENBAI_007607 [Crenichthys baileyi]|uniref:Uncharacterized protein n=1 Tax=Crenichthys baileyi TaxID=28760 RepID=A0AAV9RML3_9TELE
MFDCKQSSHKVKLSFSMHKYPHSFAVFLLFRVALLVVEGVLLSVVLKTNRHPPVNQFALFEWNVRSAHACLGLNVTPSSSQKQRQTPKPVLSQEDKKKTHKKTRVPVFITCRSKGVCRVKVLQAKM